MIELAGSNGSEHAIGNGNSSVRTFVVAWSARLATAESLLGTAHPQIPYAWCQSVKIDPHPADPQASGGDLDPLTTAIGYSYAKLTATYATDWSVAAIWPTDITAPSIRADTTLQISGSGSGEFMRLPARSTRWEDATPGYATDPMPHEDSPAGRFLVRSQDITLHWNYVDDPPIDRFDGLQGCVNDDTYLGKPAGSLLFAGYEFSESTKAAIIAPMCWAVRVTLQCRRISVGVDEYGWNHEYREDGWHEVRMFDGTDWVPRYTPADFSDMFT